MTRQLQNSSHFPFVESERSKHDSRKEFDFLVKKGICEIEKGLHKFCTDKHHKSIKQLTIHNGRMRPSGTMPEPRTAGH